MNTATKLAPGALYVDQNLVTSAFEVFESKSNKIVTTFTFIDDAYKYVESRTAFPARRRNRK